jgi:hypothetical protein
MKKILIIGIFLTVLGLSVFANAELQDNGNDLIYDTDLDITWYIPNISALNWYQATAWVENLTVGGVGNWRLPSAINEDGSYPYYGYGVVGSELGHLYYEALNNPVYGPLTNTGSFNNLRPVNYWSGTVTAHYADNAFVFCFNNGKQGHADKNLTANFSAIAVHPGNIGPLAAITIDETSRSKRNPLSAKRSSEGSLVPISPQKISIYRVR